MGLLRSTLYRDIGSDRIGVPAGANAIHSCMRVLHAPRAARLRLAQLAAAR